MKQSKYLNGHQLTLHEDTLPEPLIESLGKLNLENIDWVVVGVESGPQTRPMREEWIL